MIRLDRIIRASLITLGVAIPTVGPAISFTTNYLREARESELKGITTAYRLGQSYAKAIDPRTKILVSSLEETCREVLRRNIFDPHLNRWEIAFNKGCAGESLTIEDKRPTTLFTGAGDRLLKLAEW